MTKGGLHGQLNRVLAENRRLKDDFIRRKLRVLGIDPSSEAGMLALREYDPFDESGGTMDRSTLGLRTFLHDRLEEVV